MPSDLPLTGKAWLPEDSLVVNMATEALLVDCYRDAGYEAEGRSSADWIAIGQWERQDHVLGIQRAGAARLLGYEAPPHPGDLGSRVNRPVVDSCHAEVDQELGGYLTKVEPMRMEVEDRIGDDANDAAERDLRVQDAVAAWQDCMREATGLAPTTPAGLARDFQTATMDSGTLTEREIAVADVACQSVADLETIWYSVVTEHERALMGDDVELYDTLVRERQAFIDRTAVILAELGVEIPSLD